MRLPLSRANRLVILPASLSYHFYIICTYSLPFYVWPYSKLLETLSYTARVTLVTSSGISGNTQLLHLTVAGQSYNAPHLAICFRFICGRTSRPVLTTSMIPQHLPCLLIIAQSELDVCITNAPSPLLFMSTAAPHTRKLNLYFGARWFLLLDW